MEASNVNDGTNSFTVPDVLAKGDIAENFVNVPPENDNTMARTSATQPFDRLLSDNMGYEIVSLLVGPEKKLFTVHKDLLLATGETFVKAFDPKSNTKGRITMSNKSPDIFRLFVDMLYTRQVPAVNSAMSENSKILRLRGLCQLYVFTEELGLQHIIRNKIFDRIQDGFSLLDILPDEALIATIYRNTPASSLLRKFIASCLVYQVRSNLDFETNIVELLKSNDEILKDFLAMVHYFVPGQDPRFRNCENIPDSTENYAKAVAKNGMAHGVWPCYFHVHMGPDGAELSEDEARASCHLSTKETI